MKSARDSWSSWLSGLNLGLARGWGFHTDMKDIRIFIASSRELVRERNGHDLSDGNVVDRGEVVV